MKSLKQYVLNHILINVAKKNTPGNIRRWISLGADVNTVDSDKTSVLMWASYHGQVYNVSYLIKAGANVNHTNYDNWTALILAAAAAVAAVVDILIKAGADVNHKTIGGTSALIFAAGILDDTRIVDMLLRGGADVNYYDYDNRCALTVAARNGNTGIIKQLLAVPGINVNIVDTLWGRSALGMGIYNGHVSTVEVLLEHPRIHSSAAAITETDINLSPNSSFIGLLFRRWHLKQSLCYAAGGTHVRGLSIETALRGLNKEEISYARDFTGCTSLTNAIKAGNLKGVDTLLKAGASLIVAGDLQGTSVGRYAMRYGYSLLGEQLYNKTLKTFCSDRPAFNRLRSEIVVGNRVPSVASYLPREIVHYILEFVIKIELPVGF